MALAIPPTRPQRLVLRPACAAAAALFALHAGAQSSGDAAAQLDPITITAPGGGNNAGVTGFGDTPLARSPVQASVVDAARIRDGGGVGLTALTRYDASISDAYDADGYWTSFNIRGYATDNRTNFLRDGLPINAETSLPLDNKAGVEVLKGTSGIQAGTSAPGGLVNLVVKRPAGTTRSAGIGWRSRNTVNAWADIGQRFGAGDAFGLRLNVAVERLDPLVRDARGHRSLAALAGDWRIDADTLIEAEVESSRQSQPSVPGFSLLGSQMPSAAATDPRINLNNQPWTLPVVLEGETASLRLQRRLAGGWKLAAQLMQQRLHSDDRLDYAYGCSAEGNYDRYCSDGSFDYYEFRSDGERRITTDLDVHAQGRVDTGAVRHELTFGALATRFRFRTQPQADGSVIVGQGNVNGQVMIPALPADLGWVPNTDRTERSNELYLRDHVRVFESLGLWLGLRHSRIGRDSIQTDGSQATSYTQSFTTPWLAASWKLGATALLYASWGEGIQSTVAPNKPGYINAGQPLPAIESRQTEIGIKGAGTELGWSLNAFDIRQPQFDDVASGCDVDPNACITTRLDGTQRNRGLEASLRWSRDGLTLQASAMALRATISGNSNPDINGKRPTNVPARTLKFNGDYAIGALPGLKLQAGMVFEGERMVLPDNSVSVPGWARWDLGASYELRSGATTYTWSAGVDNATDRRAWRESPYEYQHVYLFPLAPRTWRLALRVNL
ncbi:MAG: TonB-dependent siderophore receptor [Burkholderiales bacterium]|nr:TonB-dependent siderophore receptor [Burkholderiales bacterium]